MVEGPDRFIGSSVEEKAPEEIRADMEETRASLTEKLQTLEDTVKDTFHNVKQTVDPRHQLREHPWMAVGGAVVAGFVLGRLAPSRPKATWPPPGSRAPLTNGNGAGTASVTGASAFAKTTDLAPEEAKKPGLLRRLAAQFSEEIEMLENAAVCAGIGAARDWAKESLPRFAPDIDKAVNRVIAKVSSQHG